MEGYQQLFALIKNPKYVKMAPPENRAAIRIEQYCKRRKDRMKPKRQEDSSCVFAYYFVAALAIAAIPQKKRKRRNCIGTDQKKGVLKKAVGTIRQENRQGRGKLPPLYAAVRVRRRSCRVRISPIRRRTDQEPSAAEFSGLVSATAPLEQGVFAPCGFVLTSYK